MQRGVAWLIAGIVLWLGASPGIVRAGELRLGATSKVGYDSNVFSRSGEVDGGDIETAVIQFSGFGQVKDELERGSYMLRYQPTYFINSNSEADNTWNHQVNAEGQYNFSHRTQVRVANTFRFLEKITFSPTENPDPDLDDSNRRTISNEFSVGGSHLITKFTSLYANGSYMVNRYSQSTDEDNELLGGNAGIQHVLTRQLSVGMGGQASYRTFQPERNRLPFGFCQGRDGPGSRSLSYSGVFFVAYTFSETMTANAQGGPARIESDDHQCLFNPFVRGSGQYVKTENEQDTWFASGEFIKHFKNAKTSVRYRRSEGLGGVGTTTVNDTLSVRFDWTPARHWDLGAQASWIQRSQDTGSRRSSTDSMTWTASGSVARQIAKRTRVSFDLSYRKNEPDGQQGGAATASTGQDYDIIRAFVGIKYEFDPIRY
jgi:hypothetical protein